MVSNSPPRIWNDRRRPLGWTGARARRGAAHPHDNHKETHHDIDIRNREGHLMNLARIFRAHRSDRDTSTAHERRATAMERELALVEREQVAIRIHQMH